MTRVNLITRSTAIRVMLAAVIFVLAHDLIMAMDSHAVAQDNAAHHQEQTQTCGTIEGARLPEPPAPDASAQVAFITSVHMSPPPAEGEQPDHQIWALADASDLRAMLQVFLN